MSNLRYNKSNSTYAFNEVQQIKCVQGNYPPRLLDLWDLFDEVQGSENDCPEIFPSNQLFIVLQLANGGKDLESFVFNNAMQAYAMFEQVNYMFICAMFEQINYKLFLLCLNSINVCRIGTLTICIAFFFKSLKY